MSLAPRRILVASLLCLSVPAAGGALAADDDRRFTVTPYLWLPTINSELRFDAPDDGGSIESEIGPSDYLTNLNGVFMVAAELTRGQWAFSGDLIWIDLTADVSTVHSVSGEDGVLTIPRETDLGTTTDLSGMAVTLSVGRQLLEGGGSSATAFAGTRYFTLEADLDWELATTLTGPGFTFSRAGSVSGDTDLYDAVVGARGRWRFGDDEHWSVPWYIDFGAGSSDLTWQAMAGVSYTFTRASWLLVWRHLDYEDDGGHLLRELRFDGPAVGFSWRW